MNIEQHDIIIVGGGISGIGCARTLHKKRLSFKLITENIGGRILFSKDGVASFGPWYARQDYTYVRPFLNLLKRVTYFDVVFHKGKKKYRMFGWEFFSHPIQAVRAIRAVNKYKKEYLKFKKLSLTHSQKEVIDSNKYLSDMHHMSAVDFIKENRIEDFAVNFLDELLYGTTFTRISEMTAAVFLHFSLPLVTPVYRFNFDTKKAVMGISNNLIEDSVIKISKEATVWHLTTVSGKHYVSRYLVLSTPPEVAKKLLPIKFDKKGVGINMFYVKATLRRYWGDESVEAFTEGSDVVAISREAENSYLVCSNSSSPNLKRFFEKFEIIESKKWDPAFHTIGTDVFDTNPGENLFLTGDYNYPNIEDSFITGIYAANMIEASLNDRRPRKHDDGI
ncbi:MAG: hypothetical protein NUV60_02395 [Patescibacteria group bacterium]|nr:hypothetical protein [Patescibacteria group bacterium]